MQSTLAAERVHRVRPYLQLARVDHWFKNAFMLFGSFLALFFEPSLFRLGALPSWPSPSWPPVWSPPATTC
jgi:hypothetical protein